MTHVQVSSPAAPRSSAAAPRLPQLAGPLVWWATILACYCADALPAAGSGGERAPADRFAPVPLVVVDWRQTAELRQERARGLPPVYQFSGTAVREAEESLRVSFANARERYLDRLEAAFGERRLARETMMQDRFRAAVRASQSAESSFPLQPALAELWATGDSGELILAEWATLLRVAMTPYIQKDPVPSGLSTSAGASSVRLVPTGLPGPTLNATSIERETLTFVARSRMQSLAQAQADLVGQFPAADRVTARFLATFLKENCWFDPVSSCLLEEKETADLWAVDCYPKGEPIVRKGEILTAKAKLALREIQAKTTPASAPIQPYWPDLSFPTSWRNVWLVPALAAVGTSWALLAGWAVWKGRRARGKAGRAATNAVLITHGSEAGVELLAPSREVDRGANRSSERLWGEAWRRRAMDAERRLERLKAVFRLALATHGANGWLRRWVSGLLAERAQVWATQEQAERELVELERRFAEACTPLEERLLAYERRIAELERQLTVQGNENRALLQATIMTTRKRLETARERGPLAWN